MATVPQYQQGQVKDSAVSGGFQQIQTNSDAFGAGIAQANIQRGQALNKIGEEAWQQAFKQRDKFDQAVLKDQDNQLQTYIREQMDDPGGYLTLNGRAALDQKAIVEKMLQERMKFLGKDIDQRILDQWKTVANQRIQTAMGRISKHSATQTTNYYNQVSDSRIAGALNDSISNWSSEAEREKYINFGLNEVNQKVERLFGITPNTKDKASKDILDSARMEFTSPTHTGIVEKYLAADDYDGANTYYTIHKSEIKPAAQLALEKKIKSNTRDGKVRDEVVKIESIANLTDTEQTDMADAIDDPAIAAAVRAKIEHNQGYRDQEENQAEQAADDEALRLVTSQGYIETDQIPREIWNAMSATGQANMTSNMKVEANRVRTEAHRVAKDNVYSLYTSNRFDRSSPGPTVADILKMSGPEQLAFFDKRENDAAREDTEIEVDAYKAAKKLQVTGTLYKDMPKEITDLLTGDAIQLLQDRQKVNIERLETTAYNEGISLIEQGKEVPDELLFKMDGIQRLAIKKEGETFESTAESAAYDKLLGHLLIPGNNLESAAEAGLTKGVSNLHLTNITNAENTTKSAQAKIDKTISEMKNYVKLIDLAQSDYSGFAENWEANKEDYALAISETNWKQLDEMSRNPTTAKSIFTRREMVFNTLDGLTTGLSSFLFWGEQDGISSDAKKLLTTDGEQGDNVRGFVDEIDRRVQAWSDENAGKPVSDNQFKIILSDVASDKVFYDDPGANSQLPASFISADERDKAYVNIGGERISLSENTIRDELIVEMQSRGIAITEQKIMELYTEWKAGDFNLTIELDL